MVYFYPLLYNKIQQLGSVYSVEPFGSLTSSN